MGSKKWKKKRRKNDCAITINNCILCNSRPYLFRFGNIYIYVHIYIIYIYMSIEQYTFDEGAVDLAKLNILKATSMT